MIVYNDDLDFQQNVSRFINLNLILNISEINLRTTTDLLGLETEEFVWLLAVHLVNSFTELRAETIERVLSTLEYLEYNLRNAPGNLASTVVESLDEYLATALIVMLDYLADSDEIGPNFMRISQVGHYLAQLRADPLNLGIEERFEENLRHNINGFIYGQGNSPQRYLAIGLLGNGASHGCGPFAIYNALFSMLGNKRPEPAVIIRDLELRGGFNIGGLFGTNPMAVIDVLSNFGYDVEHINDFNNINQYIRDSQISILLYRGGNSAVETIFTHYIMIRYMNGTFYKYNVGANDQTYSYVNDIGNWINYNQVYEIRPLALIIVPNYCDDVESNEPDNPEVEEPDKDYPDVRGIHVDAFIRNILIPRLNGTDSWYWPSERTIDGFRQFIIDGGYRYVKYYRIQGVYYTRPGWPAFRDYFDTQVFFFESYNNFTPTYNLTDFWGPSILASSSTTPRYFAINDTRLPGMTNVRKTTWYQRIYTHFGFSGSGGTGGSFGTRYPLVFGSSGVLAIGEITNLQKFYIIID